MQFDETTEIVLANRMFLYGLFARGFLAEPDHDFCALAESSECMVYFTLIDDSLSRQIAEAFEQWRALSSQPLVTLVQEYNAVFVGPGPLKAPAWETVCRSGKRTLFQKELLAIRASYSEAGFEATARAKSPDDFIGTEFDFMTKLAIDGLKAFQEHDGERCTDRLKQSLDFLETHLLLWIGADAKQVEDAYGKCFYGSFAKLSTRICEQDRRVVKQLLA